jgi:hypothetical protein
MQINVKRPIMRMEIDAATRVDRYTFSRLARSVDDDVKNTHSWRMAVFAVYSI